MLTLGMIIAWRICVSFFQKEADLKIAFSEFLIKTSITLYNKNMTQKQIEAVLSSMRVYTVVGGG